MCLILWLVIRCVCLSDGGIKADCDREEATFLHFAQLLALWISYHGGGDVGIGKAVNM